MFLRPISHILIERLNEPRRFIQALIGSRQTGKTTLARQVTSKMNTASHFASADEPLLRDRAWLEQQWEIARLGLQTGGQNRSGLPGMEAFSKEFSVKKKLLVGSHGIPLEDFFGVPVEDWFK